MGYQDIFGWQKEIDLVVEIYEFTSSLPVTEKYDLSNQMQRAAIVIPSNVAEGYADLRKLILPDS